MNPSDEQISAALRLVQHDSTRIGIVAHPSQEYADVIEGVYMEELMRQDCEMAKL